jgi:methylmalonyl-CoA mutase
MIEEASAARRRGSTRRGRDRRRQQIPLADEDADRHPRRRQCRGARGADRADQAGRRRRATKRVPGRARCVARMARGQGEFARPRRRVRSARARTLGEISQAMEDVFGRYGTNPTPVSGIYGGAYADDKSWLGAEEGSLATERRMGRKPRMLVAKMGQDGHDRGANLVSSAFRRSGLRGRARAACSRRPRKPPISRSSRMSTWSAPRPRGGAQDADPRADRPLRDAGRPTSR